MSSNRATISLIAQRAGVSVGTVSNVFNGKGRFAEETRARVLRVASDLNFTPNALIRSLQSGKTNSIGIFTCSITAHVTRDISMLLLRGALAGIAATGCDALLYSRHPHIDAVSVNLFLDRRVDGLILCPGGLSGEGMRALADSGLPTVALYQNAVPDEMGAVNIDNAGGLRAALAYLIGLGHRRIAFYAPDNTFDFGERLKAYRAGLERGGLIYDPALHFMAKYDYQQTTGAALTQWLALPQPPTAILAGDDSAALAFLETIAARGLQVPADISVVGFDDAPAAIAPPGLTTVRQPAEDVGRLGADLLRCLMGGEPAENCRVTLPTEFVIRHTTGPPRKTR